MLELKAASFYRVTADLISLRIRVGELSRAEVRDEPDGGMTVRMVTDPVAVAYMQKQSEELIGNLQTLGTKSTLISASRLLGEISDPCGFRWSVVIRLCEEIHGRLVDDLSMVKLFILEDSKSDFYEPANPIFGEEAAANFPGAAFEIAEASKCYALGRSTASAFHSIRCLEAAIRAVSRCLGIPDPTKAVDRNWGKMLDAVKAELGRRWPTSTDRLTGDGQTFEEVHAALAALQNPYRNATMHLDQKYTDDESKHIFDMVGGLMKRVASRCDEMGEPKA